MATILITPRQTESIIERLSAISDIRERMEATRELTQDLSSDRRDFIEGQVEYLCGTFAIDWDEVDQKMRSTPWKSVSRSERVRSVFVGRFAEICENIPSDIMEDYVGEVEEMLKNVFARQGYTMRRFWGDPTEIDAVETFDRG